MAETVAHAWLCARPGCLFQHKWKKPGSTTFCCAACKKGEPWHTQNCRGCGNQVALLGPYERSAMPVVSLKRAWESLACVVVASAYERQVLPSAPEQKPTVFRMPQKYMRAHWHMTVLDYVEWLANEYATPLTPVLREAWGRTQFIIDSFARPPTALTVHIRKSDDIIPLHSDYTTSHIDLVTRFPLTAFSDAYDMRDVTGVNLCVQARLVVQLDTARAIEEAIICVEMQRHHPTTGLAFVCTGGTHRSLGCGCLLLILAYPEADIIPRTERARRSAMRYLSW